MTPSTERVAVLALGANLGDPLAQLRRCVTSLKDHLDGLEASPVYRSTPEGGVDQPDYLNAVVRGSWGGSAGALLDLARRLEDQAGRARPFPGASRTLDVDVLFLGDALVSEPGLRIPHPRWRGRPFVVVPLMALDPGLVDPETGGTVEEVAREAGWGEDTLEKIMSSEELLPVDIR